MVWQKKDEFLIQNTAGTTKVCLQARKVEEDIGRNVSEISLATTNAADTARTLALDLNRVTHGLTVEGYVMTTTSEMTDADVSTLAVKRTNLLTFGTLRGPYKITYRSYLSAETNWFIKRLKFTDDVAFEVTGAPLYLMVQILMLKGESPI